MAVNAPATGHEVRDASVRPVILTAIGLAIGATIASLIVYGVFQFFAERPEPQPNPLANAQEQVPPPPRIEENPWSELQTLRAQEDRILSTYEWVDRKTGIIRIPIDRAMELQLQRGFPVRKEAAK